MKGNDGLVAKKAFVKHFSMHPVLCQALEILRFVNHNVLPLGIYHLVGESKRGQISIIKPSRAYSRGREARGQEMLHRKGHS